MISLLTRNWWAVALRGVAAVLFGIAAFVWPGVTLAALVLLFGAYAFVDGVFAIWHAFAARTSETNFRWFLGLEGLAGVVLGVLTLMWPGITALVLLYLIAAWAVITGVLEIAGAIELRKLIEHEWLLAIGGVCSILFGGIMAFNPGAGALALLWVIGSYAIVFGVVLIVLGFRLRSLGEAAERFVAGAPKPGGAAARA